MVATLRYTPTRFNSIGDAGFVAAASLATSAVASTCLVCLEKAVRPSGDPGRLPTSRRW